MRKEKPYNECRFCSKDITYQKVDFFCSRSCSTKHKNANGQARKAGLASVKSQGRRSKNEIYFHELCEKEFSNVSSNEAIFNGWDADVILHDYKLAILWNGNWHYQKIHESHSLEQVQNRDRIKLKEIIKYGYTPYVIEDRGKYNKSKVESEFEVPVQRIRS